MHMQIFAVLIPIVGLGAFLWWAGRDIMQGTVRLLQNSHLQLLFLSTDTINYGIYCLQLLYFIAFTYFHV